MSEKSQQKSGQDTKMSPPNDDDATPRANRTVKLDPADRTPYIPRRKSSIHTQAETEQARLIPRRAYSVSVDNTESSSNGVPIIRNERQIAIAPLARKRFPIDGHDSAEPCISGYDSPKRDRPIYLSTGRRMLSRFLHGFSSARSVSQASFVSDKSFSPSCGSDNSDFSNSTSIVRSHDRVLTSMTLPPESSPNPLRAPPERKIGVSEGSLFDCIEQSPSETELPTPPLIAPAISICTDATSISHATSQSIWAAVEVGGFVTDPDRTWSQELSIGSLTDLTLELVPGPNCEISKVVGLTERENMDINESWIVFAKVVASPPSDLLSPTKRQSPLRSRPSSHELMDQLHNMLTPAKVSGEQISKGDLKLLDATLHFGHTCLPYEIRLTTHENHTLKTISSWGLESRSSKHEKERLSWDLHSKALRLSGTIEKVPYIDRLSLLQDLFGEDGSCSVPQLKRIARTTISQISSRIYRAPPPHGGTGRRHGMDGCDFDPATALAGLREYVENDQTPKGRPSKECTSHGNSGVLCQAQSSEHRTAPCAHGSADFDLGLQDVTNLQQNYELHPSFHEPRELSNHEALEPSPLFSPKKSVSAIRRPGALYNTNFGFSANENLRMDHAKFYRESQCSNLRGHVNDSEQSLLLYHYPGRSDYFDNPYYNQLAPSCEEWAGKKWVSQIPRAYDFDSASSSSYAAGSDTSRSFDDNSYASRSSTGRRCLHRQGERVCTGDSEFEKGYRHLGSNESSSDGQGEEDMHSFCRRKDGRAGSTDFAGRDGKAGHEDDAENEEEEQEDEDEAERIWAMMEESLNSGLSYQPPPPAVADVYGSQGHGHDHKSGNGSDSEIESRGSPSCIDNDDVRNRQRKRRYTYTMGSGIGIGKSMRMERKRGRGGWSEGQGEGYGYSGEKGDADRDGDGVIRGFLGAPWL